MEKKTIINYATDQSSSIVGVDNEVKMKNIRDFVRDIRDYVIEESPSADYCYHTLTDDELAWVVDELYKNWFDIRKTLNEQMLVNKKMNNNHYIYEARELVAQAKFLCAEAEQMMRIDNKNYF